MKECLTGPCVLEVDGVILTRGPSLTSGNGSQAYIQTVAQSAATARRPTEYWASSRETLIVKQKITSHCYEKTGAATPLALEK